MYKILTLNNISVKGLERLPRESYEISSETVHPDAILLRSFKMHDMDIPESVVRTPTRSRNSCWPDC